MEVYEVPSPSNSERGISCLSCSYTAILRYLPVLQLVWQISGTVFHSARSKPYHMKVSVTRISPTYAVVDKRIQRRTVCSLSLCGLHGTI